MPTHPLRRISAQGLAELLGAWQQGGPAYQSLADAIRLHLLSGSLAVGTRLPSERELAAAVDVSRTTTTHAYRLLREQGLLVSRPGSGTVTTLPHRAGTTDPEPPQRAPGVVDLTVAALPAPAAVYPAYRRALEVLPAHLRSTGYEAYGLDVLRAAIAADHVRRGSATDDSEILVTSGAQHAAHTVISALAGPGDRVVVEHPTYPHVLGTIRAAGARPVPVPVGREGLDIELLESTIKQVSPRVVYLIPDFQNPTGTHLPGEVRPEVREMAARHRTVVVADETLTGVALDEPVPPPLAGPEHASAHVISIGSVSKTFWGGLRVGWVRAHPDMVARLAVTRFATDISTAVLEQLVAAELLEGGNTLSEHGRAQLITGRDLLLELLAERVPAWSVRRPGGGLGLWVDLGAPLSSALAAIALGRGVRVAPGPAFGVDGTFETHLRLPFTAPREDLEHATSVLQAAWLTLGARRDGGRSAPPV